MLGLMVAVAWCLLIRESRPRAVRRAIVTMFLQGNDTYRESVIALRHSFRRTACKLPLVILVVRGAHAHAINNIAAECTENVRIKHITARALKKRGDERYKYMLAKLHLWSMVEYDQIAFYDADHVFIDPDGPESVFGECSATLCAAGDPGIFFRPGYNETNY